MDYATVIQSIKDVGFPIVICLVLIYMNIKQYMLHKEEMTKITEALNNNTKAINILNERLLNNEN